MQDSPEHGHTSSSSEQIVLQVDRCKDARCRHYLADRNQGAKTHLRTIKTGLSHVIKNVARTSQELETPHSKLDPDVISVLSRKTGA